MSNSDVRYNVDEMIILLHQRRTELIVELVELITSVDDVKEELENNFDFEDAIVDISTKIVGNSNAIRVLERNK